MLTQKAHVNMHLWKANYEKLVCASRTAPSVRARVTFTITDLRTAWIIYSQFLLTYVLNKDCAKNIM